MNLSFAGTPEFSAVVLRALLEDRRHDVKHVYTRPDRPAGRGRKTRATPVKQLARQYAIPVKQPATAAELAQDPGPADVDALVVVAYGMIIPAPVLSVPRYGCINVHASLLPRWRGAAPVQRAIQAGDAQTGISIMLMDQGLDTGAVLLQKSCEIGAADTSLSLSERLAGLGIEGLFEALAGLEAGAVKPQRQDDTRATYAHKITRQEAQVDWHADAIQVERNIRAFNPAPVAHTSLNQVQLRIWEARTLAVAARQGAPGEVIAYHRQGLDVGTGAGNLRILSLQLAGKKRQDIRDLYNGYPALFAPDK